MSGELEKLVTAEPSKVKPRRHLHLDILQILYKAHNQILAIPIFLVLEDYLVIMTREKFALGMKPMQV